MAIVRAPQVNDNGTIGVRGFRAHCSKCGFLGRVVSYSAAARDSASHFREHHKKNRGR